MKPWLLLTKEEREARTLEYLEYSSSPVVDEGLLMMLRPPESELAAKLELFVWQTRKQKEEGGEW